MATHRFVVTIPNPSAQSVSVQLRLEPAKRSQLRTFAAENTAELKIVHSGLSLDACAEKGTRTLALKLEPFAAIDVLVVAHTSPATKPGLAGFHLVDRRRGRDVGGVLLVCADPPFVDPPGQLITTPNPCPATLARDMYVVQPGDDPSKPPPRLPIRPGDQLELVAQIVNPTAAPLDNVVIYLEHVGSSNLEFAPATWKGGTLGQGDAFFATWSIAATSWQTGSYVASVVVASDGFDPVRLNGRVEIRRDERREPRVVE